MEEPECEPSKQYEACQSCLIRLRFSREIVMLNMLVKADGRVAALNLEGLDSLMLKIPLSSIPPWVFPLIMGLPVLALTWHLHRWPLAQRDQFFGIPADPEFPGSPQGRSMLRNFRRWNVGLAVFGLTLTAIDLWHPNPWLMPAILSQYFFMILFIIVYSRRAWKHRLHVEPVRTADLTVTRVMPWWMWALSVLPAVVLVTVTWYLATHWNDIPLSTPIHWATNGRPDAWKMRTFRGIFGPTILGWSLLLALYFQFALTVWGARRNATETPVIGTFVGMQIGVAILFTLTQAHTALVFSGLPLPDLLADPFLELPLAMVFAVVAVPLWRRIRDLPPAADSAPRECWRAGWFYVNPDDPAWTVRVGIGFAPNFGHRWIWVTEVMLICLMLGSIWYTFA